jgi:hypothetical protein
MRWILNKIIQLYFHEPTIKDLKVLRHYYRLYRISGGEISSEGFHKFIIQTMPIYTMTYWFYAMLPSKWSR